MSSLYYSPMHDDYHSVLPGGDYDILPHDAQLIEEVRHEALLVLCVQAYNMTVTGVFLHPSPILQ